MKTTFANYYMQILSASPPSMYYLNRTCSYYTLNNEDNTLTDYVIIFLFDGAQKRLVGCECTDKLIKNIAINLHSKQKKINKSPNSDQILVRSIFFPPVVL